MPFGCLVRTGLIDHTASGVVLHLCRVVFGQRGKQLREAWSHWRERDQDRWRIHPHHYRRIVEEKKPDEVVPLAKAK